MSNEYVVVKTHNFDPETEAAKFLDYRRATAYLHWLWEDYYNEEIAENDLMDDDISHLDEANCYHEECYAKVQWDNGDYTEFTLITIYPEREEFPANWETYAIE